MTVVSDQIKQDILVPVRVTLSVHTLSNDVSVKLCLISIPKFNNIISGIKDRDIIKIGETEMLFVALCGPDFTWTLDEPQDGDAPAA